MRHRCEAIRWVESVSQKQHDFQKFLKHNKTILTACVCLTDFMLYNNNINNNNANTEITATVNKSKITHWNSNLKTCGTNNKTKQTAAITSSTWCPWKPHNYHEHPSLIVLFPTLLLLLDVFVYSTRCWLNKWVISCCYCS